MLSVCLSSQWHKGSLSMKVSLHPSFHARLVQTVVSRGLAYKESLLTFMAMPQFPQNIARGGQNWETYS